MNNRSMILSCDGSVNIIRVQISLLPIFILVLTEVLSWKSSFFHIFI